MARPPNPRANLPNDPLLNSLYQRIEELEKQNSELTNTSRKEMKEIRESMTIAREDLKMAREEISLARAHEAQLQGEIAQLKKPKRTMTKPKELQEAQTRASELEKKLQNANAVNNRLKQMRSATQNNVQGPQAQNTALSKHNGPLQPVAALSEEAENAALTQAVEMVSRELGIAAPTKSDKFDGDLGYLPVTGYQQNLQAADPGAIWPNAQAQYPQPEYQYGDVIGWRNAHVQQPEKRRRVQTIDDSSDDTGPQKVFIEGVMKSLDGDYDSKLTEAQRVALATLGYRLPSRTRHAVQIPKGEGLSHPGSRHDEVLEKYYSRSNDDGEVLGPQCQSPRQSSRQSPRRLYPYQAQHAYGNHELEKRNIELTTMYHEEMKEIRASLAMAREEMSLARKQEAQLQGEIALLKKPKRASTKQNEL
ncbi:hypothetical protein F5Y06DRAFT_299879 [Hypoxylon sp. FL0890]|nr:hypothetical protein F5Y06DRAFT_299879 [Hypoxylon sp. FL0890]